MRGRLLKTRFYRLGSQIPGFGSGNKPEQQQSANNHEHSEESDLTIVELQKLLKQTPPPVRRKHGHQTLQDEHQAQRQQEGFEQNLLPRRRAASRTAHPFKELGTAGVQHHHVAFAVEA